MNKRKIKKFWKKWLKRKDVRLVIENIFKQDNEFFKALEKGPVTVISRDMRVPLQIKSGGYFE